VDPKNKIKMFTEYCGFNTLIVANGQQPKRKKGDKAKKFFDSVGPGVFSVSNAGITPVTAVSMAQGVAVNQRVGDTIYLDRLYLNYSINAANTDIFSSCRIIVFQWHPNTAISGAPAITSILQNVALNGMYNFYDWNLSNQYIILYDRVHSLAGTAAAPTSSSNQNWYGEISLQCPRKVEFQAASMSGSNTLWVTAISDSAIAPFPVLSFTTRITYNDSD
jgi:hypothetical protein